MSRMAPVDFVEGGPHGHVQRLGHVDLDAPDVGVVPGTGEEAVGETQHMDVLGGLLAQKMVDTVDLRLFEGRISDAVELLERCQRRPERLFVDHAGIRSQPVGTDGLGQRSERRRRDGHVVDQLRPSAHLGLGSLQHVEQRPGVGAVEPTPGETQSGTELVPRPFGGLRSELLQALTHPLLEVLMRHVAPPIAHQPPILREEAGNGQLIETPGGPTGGPGPPSPRTGRRSLGSGTRRGSAMGGAPCVNERASATVIHHHAEAA